MSPPAQSRLPPPGDSLARCPAPLTSTNRANSCRSATGCIGSRVRGATRRLASSWTSDHRRKSFRTHTTGAGKHGEKIERTYLGDPLEGLRRQLQPVQAEESDRSFGRHPNHKEFVIQSDLDVADVMARVDFPVFSEFNLLGSPLIVGVNSENFASAHHQVRIVFLNVVQSHKLRDCLLVRCS